MLRNEKNTDRKTIEGKKGFSGGKLRYILGEDRFYFFDCTLGRQSGVNEKFMRYTDECGSLRYTDIEKTEIYDRKRQKEEYGIAFAPYVKLFGKGFELKAPAGKKLIDEIDERQRFILPFDEQGGFEEEPIVGQSYYAMAARIFERGDAVPALGEDIETVDCNYSENMFTLTLKCGKKEMNFSIENKTLWSICLPEGEDEGVDNIVSLANFASLDALFACMGDCTRRGELPAFDELADTLSDEDGGELPYRGGLVKKDSIPFSEVEGKKIRRRYIGRVFYILFALWFGMLSSASFERLFSGEVVFGVWLGEYMSLVIGILLIFGLPVALLAFLNRRFFGKVICVLNAEGLHYEGGVIEWKDITLMRYHMSSGGKHTKHRPAYMEIFGGGGSVELKHAPAYLYKEAKKYRADISYEGDKRIWGVLIALVLFALLAMLDND